MALRNSKIASDLVLTQYKYLSSKADLALPISSIKVTDFGNADTTDLGAYRYVVSNTKKPSVLPKIEFPKEPEELIPPEMRHLQPAMLPKFMELRNGKSEVQWESTETDKDLECPFPEPIKDLRTKTLVLSDQKKAELKSPNINVNVKTANFNVVNRNYSTSPFFIVSRSFAKASKKGAKSAKGSGKDEKCEKQPKQCKKKSDCPSFIMRDCPTGKPKSDCYHAYMDPKCSKKLAPYPSYSESCADRLEDDPSECMQCPWQKCGGVDAIRPPKRSFHTSSALDDQKLIFMQSDATKHAQYMPPHKDCDAKKEPCKRPPGKCEKQKEEKKKNKCPEQPKKKKCDNVTTAYGLWDAKENLVPTESWHTIESNSLTNVLDLKNIKKLPFDKDQADYAKVSKKKCQIEKDSKCRRKKRKNVPEGCPESGCRKDCACKFSEKVIFKLETNCPNNRGGANKGPSKKKCPVVDTTIDKNYMPKDPCCKDAKKGNKKRRHKPKVYVPDNPDY
ncbi:unnamed protein product [Phaedon cochleariae]|uniref:Uncharacterized protein n=1 Tax=Phaedon cochleariae TaxID=80249 RepID=A0A9P0GN10_PHACE|nr:unnamed protein product [Phaedon cochleariae]